MIADRVAVTMSHSYHSQETTMIRLRRPARPFLRLALATAAVLAGCVAVTPGPFLIIVCGADDTVLAQL